MNLLRTLAVLLAAVLIAGCGSSGPQRHKISGQVTFAGEPVAEGAIAFMPIDDAKGPKAGGNIQQGHYDVQREGGPVAGRHRVEITALRKTGRQYPNLGGEMIDEKENVLPPKYCGPTSELVVEITAGGKNVFDFDLQQE